MEYELIIKGTYDHFGSNKSFTSLQYGNTFKKYEDDDLKSDPIVQEGLDNFFRETILKMPKKSPFINTDLLIFKDEF